MIWRSALLADAAKLETDPVKQSKLLEQSKAARQRELERTQRYRNEGQKGRIAVGSSTG